eukprot:CAMPEP_0176191902 /NCGR_PEP_ID=MMETSP0121_2-20121125/4696_1 /TAXON_ID=160619 /ORGANISM="Kryptoperidinium foliaceum, Strain CCMP 1326" /LENGTH=62 /DNA_ID=CAMNT_0017530575 /DNA_START=413 /DNA_END=598 /DNA_ORIENTATION=-
MSTVPLTHGSTEPCGVNLSPPADLAGAAGLFSNTAFFFTGIARATLRPGIPEHRKSFECGAR